MQKGAGPSGQTVLTTGVNSGIGLATALELARRGWHSVGSVRSTEKAEVVRKAAADAGVEVDTVILDVTDRNGCKTVIDQMRPWGLINNAGYAPAAAIEDLDDDDVSHCMETMVFAPMRLARLALPAMIDAGGGRIVNISSGEGRCTLPLLGLYQGAKHALEATSDALRMEVGQYNVRVVLIEPGAVKTSILYRGGDVWDPESRFYTDGSRYVDSYRRIRTMVGLCFKYGVAPDRVARIIADSLESRRPKARYLIGLDARTTVLAQRLPLTLHDELWKFALGLRPRPSKRAEE